MKIIKNNQIKSANYGNIIVQDLINEDKHKISFAKVKIIDEQKKGINTVSDIYYYVLEGEGKFFIENRKVAVSKGDLVFIPKGTAYRGDGDLTLLAIANPRFNRERKKLV
jgi:mannose-6-phosphate isomerase-like protein (cupin superfamily)